MDESKSQLLENVKARYIRKFAQLEQQLSSARSVIYISNKQLSASEEAVLKQES